LPFEVRPLKKMLRGFVAFLSNAPLGNDNQDKFQFEGWFLRIGEKRGGRGGMGSGDVEPLENTFLVQSKPTPNPRAHLLSGNNHVGSMIFIFYVTPIWKSNSGAITRAAAKLSNPSEAAIPPRRSPPALRHTPPWNNIDFTTPTLRSLTGQLLSAGKTSIACSAGLRQGLQSSAR